MNRIVCRRRPVAGFVATSEAIADILNVPADYPTIVAAVNAASNGDEIHIDAGTYYESGIDLQGKAIVIMARSLQERSTQRSMVRIRAASSRELGEAMTRRYAIFD